MAVGLPLKICKIFLRIELENRHFAHICNFRPLADEHPTTSTQSIHRLKEGLLSYHLVALWATIILSLTIRLYGSILIRLAVEEIRTRANVPLTADRKSYMRNRLVPK